MLAKDPVHKERVLTIRSIINWFHNYLRDSLPVLIYNFESVQINLFRIGIW